MALDRALRSIRFEPRPSLEAEVLLRVRHMRIDRGAAPRSPLFWIALAVALAAVGALIYLFWVRLLTLAV